MGTQKRPEFYRSIKHGGFKLLTGILVAAAVMASLTWAMTPVSYHLQGAGWQEFNAQVAAFMLSGITLMLLVRFALPWEELSEYCRRNVVGYSAWFWLKGGGEDPKCVDPDCTVTERGRPIAYHQALNERSIICVPLGGWFRRKRGRIFYADDTNILSTDWGVILCEPITNWHDGLVEFVDMNGRSLSLTVVDALRLLREMDALRRRGSWIRDSWDWRWFIQELMSAREERDMLRVKLEEALGVLDKIPELIREKQRFHGPSKGGREVREFVEEELLKLLPEGDPRRAKYEEPVAAGKAAKPV